MRRQIYELTLEDLDDCPIWEYADDEEEVEGQDEATVRPRSDLNAYDPTRVDVGTVVVKTEFVSRSGTVYYGYCTPTPEEDISDTHPVIVTPHGQVGFYFGVMPPSAGELADAYQRLGATRESLFPIQYRSLVAAPGCVTSGTIPAFICRRMDSPALIEIT